MALDQGTGPKIIKYRAIINLPNILAKSYVDTSLEPPEYDSSNEGFLVNDIVLASCVSIRGSADGSRGLVFSSFVKISDTITSPAYGKPIIILRSHNITNSAIDSNQYTFKFVTFRFGV